MVCFTTAFGVFHYRIWCVSLPRLVCFTTAFWAFSGTKWAFTILR